MVKSIESLLKYRIVQDGLTTLGQELVLKNGRPSGKTVLAFIYTIIKENDLNILYLSHPT